MKRKKRGARTRDLCVLFEREHDFRRSVPSSCNVFGHESGFCTRRFGGLDRPCETEVTNFQVAVGIQEEVRRFEVTVDDVGRV